MGATSSKQMQEYCGEYGADKNYEYYSGERFCVIPDYLYADAGGIERSVNGDPKPNDVDAGDIDRSTGDADEGYSWYTWWR